MPSRSFRIIFSAVAALSTTLDASNAASESPPALPRSLWQAVQYCLTTPVCDSASAPDCSASARLAARPATRAEGGTSVAPVGCDTTGFGAGAAGFAAGFGAAGAGCGGAILGA